MMTPSDINNAMRDLMNNILNSIKETLDSKGLTELTFFEAENVPTLCFHDMPHTTFGVCEDTEYLLIRKVIKVNGVWGFIHYDTYMQEDEFVKPLHDLSKDFEQAQALHNFIYNIVVRERNPLDKRERRKRVRTSAPADTLGDIEALAELKRQLEGGE